MRKNNLLILTSLVFLATANIAYAQEETETPKSTIDKIDQSNFSGVAVLQGLNKVTAKTSDLRIKIGGQLDYGRLIIKAKKCWKSPPDQRPENKILVEVDEVNEDGSKKQIFNGWMFSSSPSISGIEHPVYDLVAIECKN